LLILDREENPSLEELNKQDLINLCIVGESAHCVQILAAYGVDLTSQKARYAPTPLQTAAKKGLLDIVEVFVSPKNNILRPHRCY